MPIDSDADEKLCTLEDYLNDPGGASARDLRITQARLKDAHVVLARIWKWFDDPAPWEAMLGDDYTDELDTAPFEVRVRMMAEVFRRQKVDETNQEPAVVKEQTT